LHSQEEDAFLRLVKNIGEPILTSILIGALSPVPVVGAVVVPLYTAYKLGLSGKKVLDAYMKAKKNKEGAALKAGEKEVVKFIAGEITSAAVEHSAALIGEGISRMARESGAISEVAKNTNVGGDVLSAMLQGSVETGIREGFGAFSDFIIEESG
jgi:hypothetical protein